jgi:hypothetical protein
VSNFSIEVRHADELSYVEKWENLYCNVEHLESAHVKEQIRVMNNALLDVSMWTREGNMDVTGNSGNHSESLTVRHPFPLCCRFRFPLVLQRGPRIR